MAKRLTDNINSQFFEAANRMTSKKAQRKIVAYGESYDDEMCIRDRQCPYFTTAVYDLDEPMTLDYSELDSFVILIGLKRCV